MYRIRNFNPVLFQVFLPRHLALVRLTHEWTQSSQYRSRVVGQHFKIPRMTSERAVLCHREAKTTSTGVNACRVNAHVTFSLGHVLPKCSLDLAGRCTFGFACRALVLAEPHALCVTSDSIKRVQWHIAALLT